MRSRRGEHVALGAAADEHAGRSLPRRGKSSTDCTFSRFAAIIAALAGFLCLWNNGLGAFLILQTTLVRPPVRDDEPRQLLVVGTQSSGTTGMTDALKLLNLEVEHENSNSAQTMCRDGTVSWFHGIRFFPGEASSESVEALCRAGGSRTGFHPKMFRNARSCWAEWFTWGDCWRQTCKEVIRESWGCAHRSNPQCETPFVRSLLQVRHPLRVVESLGVKFCASADAPLNQALADLLSGLWPSHAHTFHARGSPGAGACLVALGWYWTLYHESLLGALDSGVLHGWYHVEGSQACEVARLAGFDSENTALFAPSARAYARACVENSPPLHKKRTNQRNLGKLHIGPKQIDSLDAELGRRMRTLAINHFGYDYDDEHNATQGGGKAENTTSGKRLKNKPRVVMRRQGLSNANDWRGGPPTRQ